MSTTVPPTSHAPTSLRCGHCEGDLAPGAVVCERCHTLVHAGELESLSAQARMLEANGQPREAREIWLQLLPMLPQDAKQADWVRDHARALEIRANTLDEPKAENPWGRRLAPLGPVALLLVKAKTALLVVFKLKFLLSLAAFVAVYWALYGWKFGIGFAAAILIHEMGHFVDIRRRGLPAEMPVFLPGLGAYVRWQALGVTVAQRAQISLAGPLAGVVAAAASYLVYIRTGVPLWAALTRAGAWLNVMNLIPIWVLDGGQAALALSRNQRILLGMTAVVFWMFFGEGVFLLVAAGAVFRCFTKDQADGHDNGVLFYYAVVLAALGCLMHAVPGKGF